MTGETWLRILAAIIWIWVSWEVLTYGPFRGWLPWRPATYVKLAVVITALWRLYVVFVAFEPGAFTQLTRLLITGLQPTVFIVLGFAIVLAVKEPNAR